MALLTSMVAVALLAPRFVGLRPMRSSEAPRMTLVDAEDAISWGPLAVPDGLHAALQDAGYSRPLPIQLNAMPLIADGENVVLHAETGSGKTLAYLTPLLAALDGGAGLQVVVVCPSQELAVQIATEAKKLLHRDDAVLLALSTSAEAEQEQQERIQRTPGPVQVAVGTPQRLLDLLGGPRARGRLKQLRAVVLDEVDAMLPPAPPGLELSSRGGDGGTARGSRGRARGRGRAEGGRASRGGRGGRGARGGGRGGERLFVHEGFERRLAQRKPAELLLERLQRNRPSGAPPLQLVSCSATVDAPLRRQLGLALGGQGKKAAGVVVTAEPAHPLPARLKKRGVGGVATPSTITHSAYVGKQSARLTMLQVAFEEHAPRAPLLVLPNGASLQNEVKALRKAGFDGAVALHDALGVPSRGGGGGGGSDASAQEEMLRRRSALAASFVASSSAASSSAASQLDDGSDGGDDRDDGDDGEYGPGAGLSVPLLVTTELAARGVDFKAVDAVFMLGLPSRLDSYVHVAGRTAREGRKGRAISLITSLEEEERLAEFRAELGLRIEMVDLRFIGK